MNVLDVLIASAGQWAGKNRLMDPHTNSVDESPGTAIVTPGLGDRSVRIDYTWAYHGSPQEGSLLIGYDASRGLITSQWIDSWHMGDKAMACEGPVVAGEPISVRGSYAAPAGPDLGWRIIVAIKDQRLQVAMHNITPDGREDLAVEAEYSRATP
ncbi:MAG: DUF1579 family protein [Isosphaeraceae bacterium]|jgi:hypothetical protein